MTHSYFASLLENYRRRMDMDTSVLAIRKALYNSYQNESFKLKERQRHAMAKQRREEVEKERILRNRAREIVAKEREISKRYEHLRKNNVKSKEKTLFPKINVSGWQNEHATTLYQSDYKVPRQETTLTKPQFYAKENSGLVGKELSKLKDAHIKENRDETLALPAINNSRWRDENAAKLYESEYRVPVESAFTKPCLSGTNNRMKLYRGSEQEHKNETMFTPPSPMASNFSNYLVNYYRNGKGLTMSENARAFGKKTSESLSTRKFGEQNRQTRQRGPFNMSSPAYDILVVEHGKDDSS